MKGEKHSRKKKKGISILISEISLERNIKLYPIFGGGDKSELQNYLRGDWKKFMFINNFLDFFISLLCHQKKKKQRG